MKMINLGTAIVITTSLMFGGTGDTHDHSKMMKDSKGQAAVDTHNALMDVSLPSVQCGMCQNTIETGLSKVKGIKSVDVDITNKVGRVSYNPDMISELEIEQSIAGLGYFANSTPADKGAYKKLDDCCQMSKSEYKQMVKTSKKMTEDHKSTMKTDASAMKSQAGGSKIEAQAILKPTMVMIDLPTVQCGMCQRRIQGDMAKVDGILEIRVDIDNHKGHVVYNPALINLAEIESAISEIGYQANEKPANKDAYENLPGCCQVP